MSQIMVSRRDGIATGPDGTKYRVHRGKTLADARHPLVVTWPGDWSPMVVDLTVDGPAEPERGDDQLDELRNELAELEETAQALSGELTRLLDGLMARGCKVPPEDDRQAGWLVEFTLRALDQATSADAPDVAAPREPRAGRPRAGR